MDEAAAIGLAASSFREGMNTDEPRWLDDEEQQTWFAMVSMLVSLPAALDAQLQRDTGISHFEYQVIAGLSMSPDRTRRMSDLADFAEASLSRPSHTAKRLENKGWLTRTPDPADGHFTLWPPSPKPAGTRSPPPHPATSPKCTAFSSIP